MTKSVFGDTLEQQIYVSLNIAATIISTFASVICIAIIHKLTNRTGHLQLVLWMNYFQAIFNITLFAVNVDVGNAPFQILSFAAGILTGTCVGFLCVWVTVVATYIVVYKKPFYVMPNFHWILATGLIPSLFCGIFYLYCTLKGNCINLAVVDIYDNLRIGLIGINFLFIFVIMYKIDFFGLTSRKNKSEQELAIRTVAFRLIPYPILLALSRTGITWYNIQFGAYRNFDNLSVEKTSALMFVSLSVLIAGLGFLLVLLVTQPHAYGHFKAILRCEQYIDLETLEVESNMKSTEEDFSLASSDYRLSNANRESNVRKSRKSFADAGHDGRFSFYDLRTDEELMEWIEDDLSISKDSMFANSSHNSTGTGGISLQEIHNPLYRESTASVESYDIEKE